MERSSKPPDSAATDPVNSDTELLLPIGSQHLPGLGSGQILPDWVHNLIDRLRERRPSESTDRPDQDAVKVPLRPMAPSSHYDPEVDIATISFEDGRTLTEEHAWGLVERHPDDGHLMGFEIREASKTLPAEMLAALGRQDSNPSKPTASAA